MLFVGCPIHVKQIQDGGRPTSLKKMKNDHVSATVRPIGTKFGLVTQISPPTGQAVKISNF